MSKYKEHIEKVTDLLSNRSSVVYIQTDDNVVEVEKLKNEILPAARIFDLDKKKNGFQETKIITWLPGLGFRELFTSGKTVENLKDSDLVGCIREMAYLGGTEKKMLLIEDLHYLYDKSDKYFSESYVDISAALLEFYRVNHNKEKDDRSLIVIISSKFKIPQELVGCISVVDVPMPEESDIEEELGLRTLPSNLQVYLGAYSIKDGNNGESNIKYSFPYTPEGKEYKYEKVFFIEKGRGLVQFETKKKELISYLIGMSIGQIRAVLAREGNNISTINLDRFRESKEQLVKDSGLLKIETIIEGYEKRLGNIKGLVNYIKRKKVVFDNKIQYLLPLPKGILLVGPPGCGKSESSKAIASMLNMPLVSLDMGRLLGNLMGDSEHNFEKALSIAEAAQPCVLWIDEIEKAFAGADAKNNDDTMTRILGHLLTWMQEREKRRTGVYIVATANDLSTLRPEFLRKGRWDEIFYLTYPDEKGVVNILNSCIRQYDGLKIDNIDRVKDSIQKLYSCDNRIKLSGADIKSAVQETYDNQFFSLYNKGKLRKDVVQEVELSANELSLYLEKIANKNNDAEIKKLIDREIDEIKYQLVLQSPNSIEKFTNEKKAKLRSLSQKKAEIETNRVLSQKENNIKAELIDFQISSLTSNQSINIESIKEKLNEKYKLLEQVSKSNRDNEIEESVIDFQISLLNQEANPQDYQLSKEKEDNLREMLWKKYKQDDRKESEEYFKSMGFQSAASWSDSV